MFCVEFGGGDAMQKAVRGFFVNFSCGLRCIWIAVRVIFGL